MSGWFDDGSEEEAQMMYQLERRQYEERRQREELERLLELEAQRLHELKMEAAEDLYAALQAAEIMVRIMLECWGNTSTNDMGKFRNITGSSTLAEIRAAIAKADGKAGA